MVLILSHSASIRSENLHQQWETLFVRHFLADLYRNITLRASAERNEQIHFRQKLNAVTFPGGTWLTKVLLSVL